MLDLILMEEALKNVETFGIFLNLRIRNIALTVVGVKLLRTTRFVRLRDKLREIGRVHLALDKFHWLP